MRGGDIRRLVATTSLIDGIPLFPKYPLCNVHLKFVNAMLYYTVADVELFYHYV